MEYKSVCCVLGAILINLTLGTFYSIGNVTPYVASYMRDNGNPDVTSEHATWITASFLLGQGVFIIVGSYIERLYDSRIACIFGCTIHCASTFLTMWAVKVSIIAVILVYGFGSGLGCGSAYMASIIAAQKWFPTKKGIFTGVIVAGFGLGGLVFTNLQTLYLNPNNRRANPSGYFDESVHKNVPKMFFYMGIIFTLTQTIGCLLAFPPPKTSVTSKSIADVNQGGTIVNEEPLPQMDNTLSAFKYRIFYVIGLMMMLVAPGVVFVNSLGKRYGQSYIQDDRFLTIVLAFAAVANASGRITWGYLSHKFTFSICFTVKVLLFASLVVLFPFAFVLGSPVLYVIWILGLFFGFSGTFVLFPVYIEQVFGAKYHGIIYGILYIFLAISSIITSFVIQTTIAPQLSTNKDADDKLSIRAVPCSIIGLSYFLSLAIYFLTLPVRRLENAIRRRKDVEISKTRNSLFNRQDLYPIERASLAEKTASVNTNEQLQRENSLGSIVRFSETPAGGNRINKFTGIGPTRL